MNANRMLLASAALGLSVLAGLLGAGGTWALWNASAPAGAGAVQSATFEVEINGAPMSVDGVAATIDVQSTGPLTPGSPAYAAVTVANRSDAGGPFTVRASLGTPRVTASSVALLATSLTIDTAVAPASGQCSAASYGGTAASTDIAKASSARFCVRTSLPANAPDTLSGATATVAIPVTATQLP